MNITTFNFEEIFKFQYCKSVGAMLAEPRTPEYMQYIEAFYLSLQGDIGFWIGKYWFKDVSFEKVFDIIMRRRMIVYSY